MRESLLLFDIDGTLLWTHGAGGRAMRSAAAQLFGESFTFDGVPFGGRLDPAIFADAAKLSGVTLDDGQHDRFRELYLTELRDALTHGDPAPMALPGIHPLLADLRRRAANDAGLVLGLLSGNYQAAAPLKLASVGIEPGWFALTALGDEAATRPDLVELAMQRYHGMCGRPIDPRRTIVIGDTPHDVDCAKAHGCVAFAVATGPFELAELEAAGADVAVADLSDPEPLLAFLE